MTDDTDDTPPVCDPTAGIRIVPAGGPAFAEETVRAHLTHYQAQLATLELEAVKVRGIIRALAEQLPAEG